MPVYLKLAASGELAKRAEEAQRRLAKVRNYVEVNRAAVKEMHRQVSDLVLDEQGIALRGLLVRHLVMPHGIAGTERVLEFLANKISVDTYLNLMDQYGPRYRAREFAELGRPVSAEEYRAALAIAAKLGLSRLDGRHAPASKSP